MGGRDGQMGFGKSRAKLMAEDQIKIRFSDVAGCEEAKHDVWRWWTSCAIPANTKPWVARFRAAC